MADKELRKLNRRELLKMLLVQCEETERMQIETDEMRQQLETFMESYERLKKKLDIKDARLNQKDAKIAELNQQIEQMKTSKEIELTEAGSIAEAAIKINGVFEAAQRAAEQYLMNIRQLSEKETAKKHTKSSPAASRTEENRIPFEPGRISGIRKKPNPPRTRQVVPMSVGQMGENKSRNTVSAEASGTEHMKLAKASGDING